MIQVDKNILCAFDGIEEIVKQRSRKSDWFRAKQQGYNSYMQEINAEIFVPTPELIGRLPVFAALEQLTVDDLVCILKRNQEMPCWAR